MGDDIVELRRLRKLRLNLDLPAYLFERFGGDCKGDCDKPVAVLTATLPEALTCCNLQPIWEYWLQTRRLEKGLNNKIQQNKAQDPEPVEAPLADKYVRTFTGTYVGRKLVSGPTIEEQDNGDELDKGTKVEVQKDYEVKATGTDDGKWYRW